MSSAASSDVVRQTAHWESAVQRLAALDELAAPSAWASLEGYLGVAIRRSLGDALRRLELGVAALRAGATPESVHRFRHQYTRVESVLDFFIDAINTRSSPAMAARLRTCDWLAAQSMAKTLLPLGVARPPVLVYVDKGLGAAILKAGLRLWDGATENPAAAIKVTLHNLSRPTALIHEAGHQVAHLLGWTKELATRLDAVAPAGHGEAWAAWASEIAADAYAFVNTGYASVVALADVIDAGPEQVFHWERSDPHPVAWIRVLLGVAMCRVSFGSGPWDAFEQRWVSRYPIAIAPESVRRLLGDSRGALDKLAAEILQRPYRAFGGRPLTAWIDPAQVSPAALLEMERDAGAALYVSPYWARQGLRIVALTGYRVGVRPEAAGEALKRQQQWMEGAAAALRN